MKETTLRYRRSALPSRHKEEFKKIDSFSNLPTLGELPSAYTVWLDREYIGIVVGSLKHGKQGWECWGRDSVTFLASGFGSRRRAAKHLLKIFEAMQI